MLNDIPGDPTTAPKEGTQREKTRAAGWLLDGEAPALVVCEVPVEMVHLKPWPGHTYLEIQN